MDSKIMITPNSSNNSDFHELENLFVKDEETNILKPENILADNQLKDFIKAIYCQGELNEDKYNQEPQLASHGTENNNELSSLEKDEYELGKLLKEKCYRSGMETNLAESAKILHKLALNYRKRSPNKLSLIRSAALYNAALIRAAESKDIEEDLQQLCSHILELACAKQTDADLVKKAYEIKQKITSMRNKVKKKLNFANKIEDRTVDEKLLKDQEVKKIHDIQTIQDEISTDYSNIMNEIAVYCYEVMGDSDCKFSIVGMGSLARKEITPYSDFEHIILLEEIDDQDPSYECKLEYFRWYSVIFHVIVINLKETLLSNVDIFCLRNSPPNYGFWFYDEVTQIGISFDALLPHASKVPLGKQEVTKKRPFKTELIKPVSKLLEYLSSEENLKNGYHLADILTKVCYVYGEKSLFEEFQRKMYELLESKDSDEILEEVKQQLNEDIQNFAVRAAMLQRRLTKSFNIKKVVYRSTTLFIAALGRFYNIRANSCFEIIEQLCQKNLITANSKHKLKFGVALSCEMRLRWYMQSGKQNDEIRRHSYKQSTNEMFTSLVGKASTISYFQIVYSLQCDVAKRLKVSTKSHFHSDPIMFNHKIVFCLNCENETDITVTSQKGIVHNRRFFDFDECLLQMEETLKLKTQDTNQMRNESSFPSKIQVAENYKRIADKCNDHCRYDDAYDFYEMCICTIKELGNAEQSIRLNKMHSDCLYEIGYCLCHSNKASNAINNFRKSVAICKSLPQNSECYNEIARCLRWMGVCLNSLQKFSEAMKYLEQSLQILQSITNDIDTDGDISYVLGSLSDCYVGMQKQREGERYLLRSIQIQKKLPTNKKSPKHEVRDRNLDTGYRLYNIGKHDKALEYLQQYLKDKEEAMINNETDSESASVFDCLGCCLYDINRHEEAMEYLQKSLKIRKMASLNVNSDKHISVNLHNIGCCLNYLNRHEEAIEYFQKSLKIRKQASLNIDSDKNIAFALHNIGCCFYDLNKYEEAKEYFQKSLKIKKQASLSTNSDKGIALTLYNIGRCLYGLNSYKEALEYFQKLLKIKEEAYLNLDSDKLIASTFDWIGLCLHDLNSNEEAMKYFQKSLKIKNRTSLNIDSDKDIASIIYYIGLCLYDLKRYEEAMEYFQKSLKIRKQASLNIDSDKNIALTLDYIGRCLYDLNRHEEAIEYFQKSLKVKKEASLKVNSDAFTLYNIGKCLYDLKRHEEALEYFQKSLKIRKQASLNIDSDKNIDLTFCSIGRCLYDLNRHEEALEYFQKSLKIRKQASLNIDSHKDIAFALDWIGLCLYDLNRHEEALEYFQNLLKIRKQASLNINADKDIALTFYNIGRCLYGLNRHAEAKEYFQQLLKIRKQASLNIDSDKHIAVASDYIAQCLYGLNRFEEALEYFQTSLKIEEVTSLNVNSDKDIALTVYNVARCLYDLNRHEEAMEYFQKSLKIKKETSLNVNSDKDIALTLYFIGHCLYDLNRHEEALKYFHSSLKIDEEASLNVNSDKDIALTLYYIGHCLYDLNRHEEALEYYQKSSKIGR